MIDLIRMTRELLVSTPDTVCLDRARLATEGYRCFGGEPICLCRAKTFAHILDNMVLDLHTNPVFAGNTSSLPRAWMLLPEYGFIVPNQAIQEHPELDGFLDGDVIPAEMREFWADRSVGGGGGTGHLAVDMQRVLTEGLEGIIAETESTAADVDYRRAMIISLHAVIRWAHRYADAAETAAHETDDPQIAAALSRVAEACRRVPSRPARDLFEALQAVILVHMAIHIEGHGYSVSLGLLDRILEPYYDGPAETTELLAAFLLKLSANSLWGSHSKTQAITLAGLDHLGNSRSSELTLHFLEACDLVRMPDPHIFIRWHESIDRRVKDRAVELLSSGLSMPLLIGDEETVRGFINAGVAEDDAWDYCVIGCNELGIPGKLASSASGPTLNWAVVLRETLLDLADISHLADSLRSTLKSRLTPMIRNRVTWWRGMADRVPTPFASALMDGCVELGCDLHTEMRYNMPGLMERGFINAVNGLAAVEHTVLSERSLTLKDITNALRNNFADSSVRAKLLAAPRWGDDDQRADKWATELLEMRRQVVEEIEREIGTERHVCCHVVRSLHHVEGKQIGATPDGRYAFTPLADSVGPEGGLGRRGPTALLKSVMKLQPALYWAGGYNLNLTLPRDGVCDPQASANLIALVDAFFAHGGQELQIASLDAEQLRDAQRHPQRYGSLLVRIAGFNALFIHLSPEEQAEMIQRAEMAADR